MENLAFIFFYIEYNGNINILDKKGRNAIHYLAMNDCTKILKVLLDYKITLDQEEFQEYQTPLFFALKYSSFKVMKILIDNNSNLNKRE